MTASWTRTLRIATRRSALAVAQTELAAWAIASAGEGMRGGAALDLPYELVPLSTEGDRRLDRPLDSFGGKGVFVKELEVALLEGRADLAVHSLKDMPAETLPEFRLAAAPEREDPRDVFVARGGAAGVPFRDLPAGARVGTGSVRRVVQLRELRPDLEYVPVRGNVQTRLSKLEGPDGLDGVVLAAAGLKRLGLLDRATGFFPPEEVVPASGQGILAIETLRELPAELAFLPELLNRANHPESLCRAIAEMAFLKALDAGCRFPVAAYAEFLPDAAPAAAPGSDAASERRLAIRGVYWDETARRLVRAKAETAFAASAFAPGAPRGPLEGKSAALGRELARLVRERL